MAEVNHRCCSFYQLHWSCCPVIHKDQIYWTYFNHFIEWKCDTWILQYSSLNHRKKQNKIIGVVGLIIKLLIELCELKKTPLSAFLSLWMGLWCRERWTGDCRLFIVAFVNCGPVLSPGRGTSGTVLGGFNWRAEDRAGLQLPFNWFKRTLRCRIWKDADISLFKGCFSYFLLLNISKVA